MRFHPSPRSSPSNKHKCPICARCFLHASDLRRHLRVHSGSKPFRCTTCSRQFNRKSNCKRHEETHISALSRKQKRERENRVMLNVVKASVKVAGGCVEAGGSATIEEEERRYQHLHRQHLLAKSRVSRHDNRPARCHLRSSSAPSHHVPVVPIGSPALLKRSVSLDFESMRPPSPLVSFVTERPEALPPNALMLCCASAPKMIPSVDAPLFILI